MTASNWSIYPPSPATHRWDRDRERQTDRQKRQTDRMDPRVRIGHYIHCRKALLDYRGATGRKNNKSDGVALR